MNNYADLLQPTAANNDCLSLVRLATLGAVIGGGNAAAQQLALVQTGQQTLPAAVLHTGQAAVMAGIVTAAGGAVATVLAEQGPWRLGILFASSAALFYYWQQHHAAVEGRDYV